MVNLCPPTLCRLPRLVQGTPDMRVPRLTQECAARGLFYGRVLSHRVTGLMFNDLASEFRGQIPIAASSPAVYWRSAMLGAPKTSSFVAF
jgi:hypothetical protein